MQVALITIFPDMADALTGFGMTRRAIEQGSLALSVYNPRDFVTDVHRKVDDRPFGGGPGMVMMVEPLQMAINAARQKLGAQARVVCLTPQGRVLDQARVQACAVEQQALILVAGRYEGIDERLIELEVDEEWSIGDYILSGGELPALVIVDALARCLPGVLGNSGSAEEDSFSAGLLDFPHYTRPDDVGGLEIPAVLKSGDHAAIRRWRLKQSLGRTQDRRPELLTARGLTEEEQQLLDEYRQEHKIK